MKSILMITSTVRGFGLVFLLGALFLTQAAAQPRLSLQVYASEHLVITVQRADGASCYTLGFGGSALAVALQGSNVIVAGNLNLTGYANFAGQTNGLWRLTDKLIPDGSFRPPRCKDIDQLAIQSDGRIIARGRLANAQGVFESDVSAFRMNSDGTFERSFIRGPAYCCPPPLTFSVATNDEIIILNQVSRQDTETFRNAFSRYHADGTLAESGVLGGELISFDAVELLTDGSFLAHWYWGADAGGGKCLRGNHWVGFRPNGSVNPSFAPAPFDFARINISISNMQARHTYTIEQSSNLIHWQDALGDNGWLYGGNGDSGETFAAAVCL